MRSFLLFLLGGCVTFGCLAVILGLLQPTNPGREIEHSTLPATVGTSPEAIVKSRTIPNPVPATAGSRDYALRDVGGETIRFDHGGTMRTFHVFPAAARGPVPRAAVILFHGANRSGKSMLDMWEQMARIGDILLIAPDALDPMEWSPDTDGAEFVNAVIERAAVTHKIDLDRLYLFGHSAGGRHAIRLANRDDGPWRAVAVHGSVPPQGQVVSARIPRQITIFMGTEDHLYPMDVVRSSARALAEAGHPVELVEIAGHTHWYY
ncbi:MAG: dienelactone hydrolase family protein, partial [Pseudomonadota bacterium]